MRHELSDMLDGGSVEAIEVALRAANLDRDEANGLLQHAAWLGRADVIPLLVGHGGSFRARNANGWAALHLAVENLQLPAVRTLLALGADVNERTSTGMTPLQLAVDVVADASEQYGTPTDLELIRALLERGGDPDAQDDLGDTARTWAEASERNELIALLSTAVVPSK